MTEDVIKALNSDKESPFHTAMLAQAMRHVKASRSKMSQKHEVWTYNDEVYRGLRRPDVEDRKNSDRGGGYAPLPRRDQRSRCLRRSNPDVDGSDRMDMRPRCQGSQRGRPDKPRGRSCAGIKR